MKKLLLIALSLVLALSLAACGGKTPAADTSDVKITVAKTSDGNDAGTALSAEDVDAFMEQLKAAEKENGWMEGTVSNSIPACYLSVETEGETTLYKYCEDGILDDVTKMNSLKLGEKANDSIHELLAGYVELGIPLATVVGVENIELAQ